MPVWFFAQCIYFVHCAASIQSSAWHTVVSQEVFAEQRNVQIHIG